MQFIGNYIILKYGASEDERKGYTKSWRSFVRLVSQTWFLTPKADPETLIKNLFHHRLFDLLRLCVCFFFVPKWLMSDWHYYTELGSWQNCHDTLGRELACNAIVHFSCSCIAEDWSLLANSIIAIGISIVKATLASRNSRWARKI
jgi:hypothetical protein